MTRHRVPPPHEPSCLSRPYPSSQKGGTLIAEEAVDLAAHLREVADPDGYRPASCPSCGHDVLHVHDYRTRVSQLPETPAIRVVRYRCAGCAGRWQILPAFVPRHLWYHWPLVEEGTGTSPPAPRRTRARCSDPRTRRRWVRRLASSARLLAQTLATSADSALVAAAQRVGLDSTRLALVEALGHQLRDLAALVHRLVPGVRLM